MKPYTNLMFSLEDIINTWRENSLSLEPIRAMMGIGLADYLHVPFTYFWSPSLLPKPSDWAPNIGEELV